MKNLGLKILRKKRNVAIPVELDDDDDDEDEDGDEDDEAMHCHALSQPPAMHHMVSSCSDPLF